MEHPTIKDVARAANVSISAVSLYLRNKPGLSDATRDRIGEAVKKSGYVPRNSKSSASTLIGLLVEKLPLSLFSDIFYSEVVRGLEGQARHRGYQLVLMLLNSLEGGELPQAIVDRQIEGLIAMGGGDLTDQLISRVTELEMPVVPG